MALDNKKYTRVSETLFDILDAIADGLSAAESGSSQVKYQVELDVSSKELCFRWNTGDLNFVTVQADVNSDTCIVTVNGDGSWYTSMTGPLNTLFGV